MAEELFAGRYALVERLGDSLWRAEDRELGREVAVRRLAGGERAAPTAAKLAHPGIVRLFDHGEADGEPYEVHEYVRGETLAARLERGPLPEPEARSLAADIQAALAYAAALGVGHGALTAENVLVDEQGHAKVRGFGAGDPAADGEAAASLLAALGAGVDAAEETQVVAPAEERRVPRYALFVAVLLGLAGGLAAAILPSDPSPERPASSVRLSPTTTPASTDEDHHEEAPAAPATTASSTESTAATTRAATTAPAETNAPPATPAPEPAPTTAVVTEEPPPATTEEVPLPPPPTESLPDTTTP